MTTTAERPTPPLSTRPGVWAQLKPLVLRLHFYAGIFIAPFILLAAVTGLIYTAAPQIENIVYADRLTVEAGSSPYPLSEQVAAAREAHPDGDLVEVRPPVSSDGSTRVVFTDDTVPADYDQAVFVDPYTTEVLGQEKTFGQWLGVRAWIDDLHRNLHLGELGRHYSELAASWLWVVVLGGLALWFTKRRSDRRLRRMLLPETAATGRRRTISWHATIGVWVALGALLLSATGLTWSRYAGENIGEIRQSLSWTGASLSTSLDGEAASGGHGGHAGHGGAGSADSVVTGGVGIDGVVATARAAGLQDPLVVSPPADAESAWAVSENKRSAPTRFDSVAVDPATGTVVDTFAFADQPFMARLTSWTIDAHMGILFGIVNQLVLAAIAIGLILIVVQGYRSWWQRRPTRGDRSVGRAPSRGAWRRTSPGVLGGVVLVTAVVAWFVPLLGISLITFLVADLLVGLAHHRRSARSARSTRSTDEHLPLA